MDAPALALALPTAAVLAALVAHSWVALPRRRAAAFWLAAAVYGVARGLALEVVVERGLGASFPYRLHRPLWPVAGVPVQEIAGWAIVAYLAWWLGDRFAAGRPRSRHGLFVTVAWACVFLAAVSWAVEVAAVAAGWWHWTVPVRHPLLLGVPFVGIVDWSLVGADLLLPFLALSSPALRHRPWRFATLLVFPLHFASHLGVERPAAWLPVAPYQLAHWGLVALLLWGVARWRVPGEPFAAPGGRARHLPWLALGVVLADAAAVELWIAGRPGLLPSLLPALAVAIQALRPAWGPFVALAALAGAVANPVLAVAALPALASGALGLLAGRSRGAVAAAVAALLALGLWQGHRSAAAERDLVGRLAGALSARDGGDLAAAEAQLVAAAAAHPGAHAPPALLAELHYRRGRLAAAEEAAAAALAVRQDHLPSHRLRTVAALRAGRPEAAGAAARSGLAVAPGDPELTYLAHRAARRPIAGWAGFESLDPGAARRVVSLAYEVGDAAGAAQLLDRALARWPGHRWFYPARVKLALAAGDGAAAERTLAAWRRRFPGDPELRSLAPPAGAP